MKLEELKEKKELISVALLSVSALIAVFLLYKITRFFEVSAQAESVIQSAISQINSQNENINLGRDTEITEKLSSNNLFSQISPRTNPVSQVNAIFDNKVLIGNNWYEAGQTIQDATIIAIEPMYATIEWDGQQRDFWPLDAQVSLPEQANSRAGGRTNIIQNNVNRTTQGTTTEQIRGFGDIPSSAAELREQFFGGGMGGRGAMGARGGRTGGTGGRGGMGGRGGRGGRGG